MSEFHEGKVAATFQHGTKLESTKSTCERDIISIDGSRAAMQIVIKELIDYCNKLKADMAASKLTVKEAEYGHKHVAACVVIARNLLADIETKRIASLGAVSVLSKLVDDVKKQWDDEKTRLNKIKEFESSDPKDFKERPVGYMPKEQPLELYKNVSGEGKKAETAVDNNATSAIDSGELHSGDVSQKKQRKKREPKQKNNDSNTKLTVHGAT